MGSSNIDVAGCVRAYRKRAGLSLKELSERTGIAASNLSAIELNKSSPTLNTLIRIADAFGLKVGAFLDEVIYSRAYLCSGTGAASSDEDEGPGHTTGLTGHVPLAKIDAALLRVRTGEDPLLIIHDQVDRFLYCTVGRLTVGVDGGLYELTAGEGLYVVAGARLTLASNADGGAEVLAVYSRVS